MRIKSGDKVVVISGKYKGKTGKVMKVFPKENRLIVEGVNMIKKHQRPAGPTQQGGILEFEAPINMSNVMYYCDNDKQGVRVGYEVSDNGTKNRVCKKCGRKLD